MPILCHQAFDISDDTDGSDVAANDFFALRLENSDFGGGLQEGSGLFAETFEPQVAAPVAEEQGCVATVVDKHRAVGGHGLVLNHERKIIVFFQNFVHSLDINDDLP